MDIDPLREQAGGRRREHRDVCACDGGSRGARKETRIGAGASIVTASASINIPRGTIVETRLAPGLRIQQ